MTHHGQVVSDNAPSYPAFEPGSSAISASVKAIIALDDTNPSFDANMEAAASPEPRLPLILATYFRLVAWLQQDDPLDTHFGSDGLVIS